jgi:hypothetical protein
VRQVNLSLSQVMITAVLAMTIGALCGWCRRTCWNGEEVAELSDCPEDDGSVTCPDGVTEVIQLSDCPELEPIPTVEPETNSTAGHNKANPYCDLLSDEQRKGTTCHDRKDISNITSFNSSASLALPQPKSPITYL